MQKDTSRKDFAGRAPVPLPEKMNRDFLATYMRDQAFYGKDLDTRRMIHLAVDPDTGLTEYEFDIFSLSELRDSGHQKSIAEIAEERDETIDDILRVRNDAAEKILEASEARQASRLHFGFTTRARATVTDSLTIDGAYLRKAARSAGGRFANRFLARQVAV